MKYRNQSKRPLYVGGAWIKQGETVEIKEPAPVDQHMIDAGALIAVSTVPKVKKPVDDSLQGG